MKKHKYKNFTLMYDIDSEESIEKNKNHQYRKDQKDIRKKRSDNKFKSQKNISKKRRELIQNDIVDLLGLKNEYFKKEISVLSVGCRDINEINFIKSINQNIDCLGIDLAPNENNSEIVQGNVENFLDSNGKKIKFERIDMIYSSHNLEHLSNPFLHFENVSMLNDKEILCYYILPCWSGQKGPTKGHPNYIHCTGDWDKFSASSWSEYLKEVLPENVNFEVYFARGEKSVSGDLRFGFRLFKKE
jgi:hypothetical protein